MISALPNKYKTNKYKSEHIKNPSHLYNDIEDNSLFPAFNLLKLARN